MSDINREAWIATNGEVFLTAGSGDGRVYDKNRKPQLYQGAAMALKYLKLRNYPTNGWRAQKVEIKVVDE